MKFSNNEKCEEYNIQITTIQNTKFLEITVDEHFVWRAHTEALQGKLSTVLYALRRTAHLTVSREAYLVAYHALFASHSTEIWYCGLWGSASDHDMSKNLLSAKMSREYCLWPGLQRGKKNKILTQSHPSTFWKQ